MPFASERQRRYLWAKHPSVARKFAHDSLSGRVRKLKRKRKKKRGS